MARRLNDKDAKTGVPASIATPVAYVPHWGAWPPPLPWIGFRPMTSGHGTIEPPDPSDLTELTVAQLLTQITQDHATATEAGRAQGETLKEMGRKAAEVYRRGELSWRQIAARTDVSVRTVRRYAEPYMH